ncbi:MAG: hypothetical protein M3081_14700 [Gemmatimonadota bacterium]|nr:hypothetical protein [Gemmatimonadota bacterium]
MRLSLRLLTLGTAAMLGASTVPAVAHAQAATRPDRTAQRERVAEDRARLRRRFEHATPEQKEWLKALSAERRQLRADVKAGKIDKAAAKAQLHAWRQAHKAPKTTG